jgi:hypothetical protein
MIKKKMRGKNSVLLKDVPRTHNPWWEKGQPQCSPER